MTLLECQRVTRRFGQFTAVDGVSLSVGAREVVGLLGPNGAGKTTVIRMGLGLLRPTEGQVRLFSEPPSPRTQARLGYVPQGQGLYEDLTVRENLDFAAAAYGSTDRSVWEADLEPFADRLISEQSLGIRRRVAFAGALAHQPELLILDEPTSGVDPLGRARLWGTIRGVADRGVGVLVSTHYMSEAQQCDRLLIMGEGRVLDAGTVEAIIGDATVVEVAAEAWDRAFATLDGAGIGVALASRRLRALETDERTVADLLASAGVAAEVAVRPASLKERFVQLVTASTAGARPARP